MGRRPAPESANRQIDETTRARLLDAAEKLFAEFGFEGTSVRAINGEADVNSGAIHYHFRTKEDLFRAVIKRRAEILSNDRLTRLARCEERVGWPPMLEQIISAYILPYANPELGAPDQRLRFARLRARLMSEQDSDPSPLGAEHKQTGNKFVEALVTALPHLSRHEVRVRYLIMWSSLNTLSAGLGHVALDPEPSEKGHALSEFERIVPELVQLFAGMFREAISLAPVHASGSRAGRNPRGAGKLGKTISR
jgi:AcrR family transcriptional regulator